MPTTFLPQPPPPSHDEGPPPVGKSLLKRAFAACAVITLVFAAAASGAGFLLIDDLRNAIEDEIEREGRETLEIPEVTRAEAGGPRTIMILGSDKRRKGVDAGIPPRSDTILLARLDPDKDSVALMSIPRDLKVKIPGNGTDKINAAYTLGGPRKTLQTVKAMFMEATGEEFEVNHVIEINFRGFREAVNRVGCVYVDVDRRYFNDNSGGAENYATIDVQPGYQKLCGQDALDYVRYRHEDDDFVRAARQQDFLRQMKGQTGVRRFLTLSNRKELARLFARYADFDKNLLSTGEIFSLGKLAAYSSRKPVREVKFRAFVPEDGSPYVEITQAGLERTMREFLAGKQRSGERESTLKPDRSEEKAQRQEKRNKQGPIPGLEVATEQGQIQAVAAQPKIDFPFYFPRLRTTGAQYFGDSARTYSIRDEKKRLHRAYRITVKRQFIGEYYGIQGTTWKDPPILDNPSETRTVNGRKLRLYFDGRKLRLVAWRTNKAVYWVTNTLLLTISNKKMLAMAASLQRVGD